MWLWARLFFKMGVCVFSDLILEGSDGAEKWVEMKSYSGVDKTYRYLTKAYKSNIQSWDVTDDNKQGNLHKQFSLDRAAATVGHAWENGDTSKERNRVAVDGNFIWRWQEFQPRKNNGTDKLGYSLDVKNKDSKSIKNLFSEEFGAIQNMKGIVTVNFKSNGVSTAKVANSHLEYANLKTLLLNYIQQAFADVAFNEAEDFLNSTYTVTRD
ncbi:hypothetical protein [Reinekea marinisedimentorum]|uniref:Uncharacterized protein n=1 Tax=Reinekea marinisedimentorum TaxID=230495 RepID=A0A4R3HT26_9GAMM|nr:hypothetical protein [Reinekea marinisedimentorum]TCS33974.1 hypothetical protein BCF53_1483 [Reinekea marinisedimentorum]